MPARPKSLTKDQVIIAAMTAGDLNSLTPVQIQKLLFLLDKRASAGLGGPFFDFEPYHYGPFDRRIYDQLDNLAENGLIEIIGTPYSRARSYRLTAKGLERGKRILNQMPKPVQEFMIKLSTFVRSLTFVQLVSAVYREYPEMRVNSVFKN